MRSSRDYLKIALSVTLKAGEFLFKNFGDIKRFTHKSKYHWGINEDLEANDIYEKQLKLLTPEVSIYTEEGEKNLEPNLNWIIDPLEGTSNYRVGNPFFATQICLLKNKIPEVCVVYAPVLKQTFTAIKGGGAFLNNNKVKVSKINKLEESLISMGKGTKYDDLLWYGGTVKNIMDKIRTFRHFGATGLELAYTASGKIDIYMNKGSRLYDYAPGVLLVREAGGSVTDFSGNEWNLNEDSLLASNKVLLSKFKNIFDINE